MTSNSGKFAGCDFKIDMKDNDMAGIDIDVGTNNNRCNNKVIKQGLPLPPPPRRKNGHRRSSKSKANGSNPLPAPFNPAYIGMTASELARAKMEETMAAAIDGNENGNGNNNSSNSTNFQSASLLNNQDFRSNVLSGDCVSKQVLTHLNREAGSLLSDDQRWFKEFKSRPQDLNSHIRTSSNGSLPGSSEFPINPNLESIQSQLYKALEYGPSRGCNQYYDTLRKAANGVEMGTVQGRLLSAIATQHRDNIQREKESNGKFFEK